MNVLRAGEHIRRGSTAFREPERLGGRGLIPTMLTRREALVPEQDVEAVREQRGHLWKFRSLGDEEANHEQQAHRTPSRYSPVFFGKVEPSFHCCYTHQRTWVVVDRQKEYWGGAMTGVKYPVAQRAEVPQGVVPPVHDNRPAGSHQTGAGQGNLERGHSLRTARCVHLSRPRPLHGHADLDSSKSYNGFKSQETNCSHSGPQNQNDQPGRNFHNGAQGNAKESYNGLGRQERNYPDSGPRNQGNPPSRNFQNGAQGNAKGDAGSHTGHTRQRKNL